jgi:alginate O-acetyltransferase complex protein AlgI
MLFNSIEFLIFLPIVLLLVYVFPARARWMILLGASYAFFLSWVPQYVALLLVTTVTAYLCALKMEGEERPRARRLYLWASIGVNLGILGVFKYFNFFSDNLRGALGLIGAQSPVPNLQLLAPLGISFYTFMALGYILDVYHRRIKAERDLGVFALFISFFPQLAAGPIERAKNVLGQFKAVQPFDYERVTTGLLRISWGFFKKLVVADRLGLLVNTVYGDPTAYTGNALIFATYAFALQIYLDFSAYSDIAIGVARILGIDLMENFKQPYFSKSVSEFWRTWHISLSTWFRDYVFFPLRRSMLQGRGALAAGALSALMIPPLATMLLSGLWHGASWTFVVWGGLHGLLIAADTLWNQYAARRLPVVRLPGFVRSGAQMLFTFHLITFTWVFFRAGSLGEALYILQNMLTNLRLQSTGLGSVMPGGKYELFLALLGVALVALVDVLERRGVDLWAGFRRQPVWLRWSAYYLLALGILIFGRFGLTEFFYVQF